MILYFNDLFKRTTLTSFYRNNEKIKSIRDKVIVIILCYIFISVIFFFLHALFIFRKVLIFMKISSEKCLHIYIQFVQPFLKYEIIIVKP